MICFFNDEKQEEMQRNNPENIICLDSTHGTNQHGFKLITMLMPHEFNQGYPVAHLISMKDDVTFS